jgi:hypothetical protein
LKPKFLPAPVAISVLLALAFLFAATDSALAGTFSPTLDVSIADPTAGANSDATLDFNLPAGDVQFGGLVTFLPGDWTITHGDEIPIGAIVGDLTARATLGIINGACNNDLPVRFVMVNSSLDTSNTVSFKDLDDNDDEDFVEDKDGNGLPDAFDHYPDFDGRILDDENGNPLQPIRRSAGISVVAGVNVLLQFLVFEPGTLVDEDIRNDKELGYPTVVLLQDAGDPATVPEPTAITDFCTPLTSTNTTFGVSFDNPCTDNSIPLDQRDPLCDVSGVPLEYEGAAPTEPNEGGLVLSTNPSEGGTYTFTVIGAGQRDADGDGLENSLDTCPFVTNVGDARTAGLGDVDEDGLDAACDPNDNETNSDQDGDGYTNRQDDCPLIPNGEEQADVPGVGNQDDEDDDFIGDACDPDPDNADAQGEQIIVERSKDLTIGPGAAGQETPTNGETPSSEGGGGNTGLIIGIIVGVVAAVVVVGGGALLLIRRRGGGSA